VARSLLKPFTLLLFFFLLVTTSSRAAAFYQWEDAGQSLYFGGFFRLAVTGADYPDDTNLFDEEDNFLWDSDIRVLLDGHSGDHFFLKANLLQTIRSTSLLNRNIIYAGPFTVERSSSFIWQQKDSEDFNAYLLLDSLNLQWSSQNASITVGRQPISLATTFYFTPNDLYAPFPAQAFFRVFKPGVDGVRAEMKLGNLSQLSLIGVLGYDEDRSSDNGWDSSPDWDRTSVISRLVFAAHGFEWGLLGGTAFDRTIAGGSLQGELADWLGLRLEGHYAWPDDDETDDYLLLNVGAEHRFPNSLTIRFEQFYNGQGFSSIDDSLTAIQQGNYTGYYLGENYSALGVGYEFSPLLYGEVLTLLNWSDDSQLYTANAIYSLSDESELSGTLSLPNGDKPDINEINSEFGTRPWAVSLEYRLYF
jgi:hypothetical protein